MFTIRNMGLTVFSFENQEECKAKTFFQLLLSSLSATPQQSRNTWDQYENTCLWAIIVWGSDRVSWKSFCTRRPHMSSSRFLFSCAFKNFKSLNDGLWENYSGLRVGVDAEGRWYDRETILFGKKWHVDFWPFLTSVIPYLWDVSPEHLLKPSDRFFCILNLWYFWT